MKDGDLILDGEARLCARHGKHAPLFECPFYPPEVREKIKMEGINFRTACKDGTINITMSKNDFDEQIKFYYHQGFSDGLAHLEKTICDSMRSDIVMRGANFPKKS